MIGSYVSPYSLYHNFSEKPQRWINLIIYICILQYYYRHIYVYIYK